jgi:hypothetical protein
MGIGAGTQKSVILTYNELDQSACLNECLRIPWPNHLTSNVISCTGAVEGLIGQTFFQQ